MMDWMIVWMITGLLLAGLFIITPYLRANITASKRAKRSPESESKPSDVSRLTNVALFKDQLDQLTLQRDRGDIDTQQYRQLENELQKQLLTDTPVNEPIADNAPLPFKGAGLLLACLLLLPVLSVGLYTRIGSAADMEIAQLLDQLNQSAISEEQASGLRNELLKRMMQRLNSQPEHLAYLVSTARLLIDEQQFLLAASYYQKAVAILPEQPEILAEYAQASYFAAGNRMTPVVEQAINQSLSFDPGNPTALGLRGIAYYSVGDYQQALISWQQALKRVPPQSVQAQSLMAGVEQARVELKNLPEGEIPDNEDVVPGNSAVVVHLRLDKTLQAKPDQVIYVFAREVDGSPMPLAVRRLRVADLPATVILDDTMAMPGGKKLSSAQQIQLVARISSTGTVNRQPDDLEGQVNKIDLTEAAKGVELLIDKPVSAMGL